MALVRFENNVYLLHTTGDNDHITRILTYTQTFYEIELLLAIRKLNLHGTYIDVGAHIGNHSVFFAQECNSTKVVSIEADPDTFDVLYKNCKQITKNHRIMNMATSDYFGYVDIKVVDPNNTGMNRTIAGKSIPCDTLDTILVNEENIVLIKLDIEGMELPTLKGAINTIGKYKPVLIVEEANDVSNLEKYLIELNYHKIGTYNATPTSIWVPN